MCDTSLHHVHGGAPKTLRRKKRCRGAGFTETFGLLLSELGDAANRSHHDLWAVVGCGHVRNNGKQWSHNMELYIYIYLWIDVWIYGYMDIWIDNQHDIWIIIIITWQNIFLIIPLDLMTEISWKIRIWVPCMMMLFGKDEEHTVVCHG